MAVFDQPQNTYVQTLSQVRAISDAIFMIDPLDTPLLWAIGGLNSAKSKFNIGVNGTKVEILEDEYDPLAGTVAGATIATDATNFTVTDASIFQDGHVIKIDNEYMVVSAVDLTNNTVTIYARNFGGTNATHTSTATIDIVGMARLEGDDADYGPLTSITAPYNYTGIFQKAVKVSNTARAIDNYGFSDAFMYAAGKRVPHLLRLVDRALFHGIRAVGSATAPRSMGGLATFISSNTTTTTTLAKAYVDSLAQSVYEDGGSPDILVMSPGNANKVRDLIDTSSFVRVGLENDRIGMASIGKFYTQYFDLKVVMDRHCPAGDIWMLDSSKVGVYTLRDFEAWQLARTGDSEKGEVVGEFSLLVANNEAHGRLTLT